MQYIGYVLQRVSHVSVAARLHSRRYTICCATPIQTYNWQPLSCAGGILRACFSQKLTPYFPHTLASSCEKEDAIYHLSTPLYRIGRVWLLFPQLFTFAPARKLNVNLHSTKQPCFWSSVCTRFMSMWSFQRLWSDLNPFPCPLECQKCHSTRWCANLGFPAAPEMLVKSGIAELQYSTTPSTAVC